MIHRCVITSEFGMSVWTYRHVFFYYLLGLHFCLLWSRGVQIQYQGRIPSGFSVLPERNRFHWNQGSGGLLAYLVGRKTWLDESPGGLDQARFIHQFIAVNGAMADVWPLKQAT